MAFCYLLTSTFQFAEIGNSTPSAIFVVTPEGLWLGLYATMAAAISICAGLGLSAMGRWANSLGYTIWNLAVMCYWMFEESGDLAAAVSLQFRVAAGYIAWLTSGLILWQLIKRRSEFAERNPERAEFL